MKTDPFTTSPQQARFSALLVLACLMLVLGWPTPAAAQFGTNTFPGIQTPLPGTTNKVGVGDPNSNQRLLDQGDGEGTGSNKSGQPYFWTDTKLPEKIGGLLGLRLGDDIKVYLEKRNLGEYRNEGLVGDENLAKKFKGWVENDFPKAFQKEKDNILRTFPIDVLASTIAKIVIAGINSGNLSEAEKLKYLTETMTRMIWAFPFFWSYFIGLPDDIDQIVAGNVGDIDPQTQKMRYILSIWPVWIYWVTQQFQMVPSGYGGFSEAQKLNYLTEKIRYMFLAWSFVWFYYIVPQVDSDHVASNSVDPSYLQTETGKYILSTWMMWILWGTTGMPPSMFSQIAAQNVLPYYFLVALASKMLVETVQMVVEAGTAATFYQTVKENSPKATKTSPLVYKTNKNPEPVKGSGLTPVGSPEFKLKIGGHLGFRAEYKVPVGSPIKTPDGGTIIHFSDKSWKLTHPNGTTVDTDADGTTTVTSPDGNQVHNDKNGKETETNVTLGHGSAQQTIQGTVFLNNGTDITNIENNGGSSLITTVP